MSSALWQCALFFAAPLPFYLATCNNLCWLAAGAIWHMCAVK